MNKLNSSEILVKHEISVQRLPRGQNLVSVTRPGMLLLNFFFKKINKIKYNSGIFFTIIFFSRSLNYSGEASFNRKKSILVYH